MRISEILNEQGLLNKIGQAAGVAKVMGQQFAQGAKKWQGTGASLSPNRYHQDSDDATSAVSGNVDNKIISLGIQQVLKGSPVITAKGKNQFALLAKNQIGIPNQSAEWNNHFTAAAQKLSQGEMPDDANQIKALELYLKAVN